VSITRHDCQRSGAPTAPCWWTRHAWSVHTSRPAAAAPAGVSVGSWLGWRRAPAWGWTRAAGRERTARGNAGESSRKGGGDSWGRFQATHAGDGELEHEVTRNIPSDKLRGRRWFALPTKHDTGDDNGRSSKTLRAAAEMAQQKRDWRWHLWRGPSS
jgi:hypothetical protein